MWVVYVVSRDEGTEQGGHRDWVNLDPIWQEMMKYYISA